MSINKMISDHEMLDTSLAKESSATPKSNFMDSFRGKFGMMAASVIMLLTGEHKEESFDTNDNISESVYTLSEEEQTMILQDIDIQITETNEEVNDTAPIEFNTVQTSKDAMKIAA